MKRRFLSVIVVLLLLLSMTVPVFADMIPYGSYAYAGELYIVSSTDTTFHDCTPTYVGHTFIVYENHTDVPHTFGEVVVQPGEQVTVGATSQPQFDGVWYNLEAYAYYTRSDYIDNTYHYYTSITVGDLLTLEPIISNWGTYNLLTHNCVHFAKAVWNAVSDTQFSGWMPTEIISQIQQIESNLGLDLSGFSFDYQTEVGYYDTSNNFIDVYILDSQE